MAEHKKLVVLCDGTWNKPTQTVAGTPCPTNVTKLAVALADEDQQGVEQRYVYREGVGNRPGERLRGGLTGFGLSREVQRTYRFLVQNYEPGDSLYFFGFSRGAYTARSTVGLVRKAGILRPEHAGRVRAAYSFYRRRDVEPADPQAVAWRESHSHPDPRIRFMGVWDTVGALGIPWTGNPLADLLNRRWSFHDTRLSSHVEAAFQALAVDERRRPYTPTLWAQQTHAEGQRLEQVWFAGDHCDVGGGHPESDLSDVALLWIMSRARECGLAFEPMGSWQAEAQEAVSGSRWDGRVAPLPGGRLHRSPPLLFRLLGQARDRELGVEPRGEESVASTVVQRWDQDRWYRPRNLRRYLDSRPDPAARRVMPIDLAGT